MGTNALSLKQGACVADIMLAETKRAMVEHANQVIVVCDHSKLSNTSLAQFASPAQIDTRAGSPAGRRAGLSGCRHRAAERRLILNKRRGPAATPFFTIAPATCV